MNSRQVLDEMNLEEYEVAKYGFEKGQESLRQAIRAFLEAEYNEKKAREFYYERGFIKEYNEFEDRLASAQLRVEAATNLFTKLHIKWDSVQQRFKEHVAETSHKEEQIHTIVTENDSKEVESETCDQVELEPTPKLKSILKPTNYPIPINHDYVSAVDLDDEEEDEEEVEGIEIKEEEVQVDEVVKEEEGHLVEPEFIEFVFAPDDYELYERAMILEYLPKVFGVGRRSRSRRYPLHCYVHPRMVLGNNNQSPEPTFYRNYTTVRGWSIKDLKKPWQFKFNLVYEWSFGFAIHRRRSFSSQAVVK